MTRDPGSLDPVYLRGRARDLYTAPDTIAKVLATAALTATVDMFPQVVQHLDVDPPVPGLHLVGARR